MEKIKAILFGATGMNSLKSFHFKKKPLYPLLKRLFPKYVTNTEEVSQAMINAVLYGVEKQTLENKDLIQLAKTSK